MSSTAPGSWDMSGSSVPPATIGRFHVLAQLGRGGMGEVWRVRDPVLGREVALKTLLPLPGVEHVLRLERFKREARALARLSHPGIVPLHEVGEAEGRPYLVMELVDGSSLEPLVERGVAPRRGAEIVRDVALALAHAHTAGIVHRDVKPSNVLVAKDGRVLLTDFGLAQDAQAASELSVTGQLLGTPHFMSPEQAAADHRRTGPASDVFALGGVLYYVLTGERPFEGDSLAEVLASVLFKEPRRPRELAETVHPDLETIVLRCLEKDPERRYPALELARELERYLAGEPIVSRPIGRRERIRRWAGRNRALALVVAGLGAALGLSLIASAVGAGWSVHRIRVERDAAIQERGRTEEARTRADAERTRAEQERSRAEDALRGAEAARTRADAERDRASAAEADARRLAEAEVAYSAEKDVLIARALRERGERCLADRSFGEAAALLAESLRFESELRPRGNAIRAAIDAPRLVWASPGEELTAVAWGPDGRQVAAGDSTGQLSVRGGARPIAARVWDEPILGLLFAPSGERVFVLGRRRVSCWDVRAGRSSRTWDVGAELSALALRGEEPLCAAWDGRVLRLPEAGEPLEVARFDPSPLALACDPAGGRCAAGGADGSVRLFTPGETGVEVRWGHTAPVAVLAWDTQGLLSGDELGKVVAWEGASPRVVSEHEGRVVAVGRWLGGIFSAAADGEVLMTRGQEQLHLEFDPEPSPGQGRRASPVLGASSSPDGKRLATVGLNGSLVLYESNLMPQGTRTRGPLGQVSLSADGKLVASGSENGAVWSWRTSDGQTTRLRRWQGAPEDVVTLAFLDEQRIVTPGDDGTLHVLGSGDRPEAVWGTPGSRIARLAIDHARTALVTVDTSGEVTVRSTVDGKARHRMRFQRPEWIQGTFQDIAIGPDGSVGVTVDGVPHIFLLDGLLRSVRKVEVGGDSPNALDFDRQGRWLAVGGWNRLVQLVDLSTGTVQRGYAGHAGTIRSVAFSPGGARLASGDDRGEVRVWDVARGELVATIRAHAASVGGLVWWSDERLISSGQDRAIRMHELGPGPLARLGTPGQLAFGSDATRIAALTDDRLREWDVTTGALVRDEGFQPSRLVALSRDGVAVVHSKVVRWRPRSREQPWESAELVEQPGRHIAVAPDGRAACVLLMDGGARYFEAGTSIKVDPITEEARWLERGRIVTGQQVRHSTSAAFGERMLVVGRAFGLTVLDLETRALQQRPFGRQLNFVEAAFGLDVSADSRYVACGTHQGAVWLWEVKDRKLGPPRPLEEHDMLVQSVAFSPDGGLLVCGGHDRLLSLWETGVQPTCLSVITAHQQLVFDVAAAQDRIASVDAAGEVRVWDVSRLRETDAALATRIEKETGLLVEGLEVLPATTARRMAVERRKKLTRAR